MASDPAVRSGALRAEFIIDGCGALKPWRDGLYRPDPQAWIGLRAQLQLGQPLTGTVVWVPRPGAIGIGVDLALSVGGFVDVLHLARDPAHWPTEGTITDFTIWWLDERPQIRLMPG